MIFYLIVHTATESSEKRAINVRLIRDMQVSTLHLVAFK